MIGKQFYRLTLVSVGGTESGYTTGLFRCSCGTEKTIRLHAVETGNTRSCGCLKTERSRETFTTHGATNTPEYRAYHEMRKRCLNPNNHAYARYGGRGITICDRWMSSFENFRDDMGPRPSPSHSLDREDNNGPYSPDNCRWATEKTQASNRRSTRKLSANGETMSHNEWARRLGVSRYMVTSRVDRGMSGEEIVAALTRSAPQVRASK